jgi:hypothetical protein
MTNGASSVERIGETPSRFGEPRGEAMVAPEEVAAMLRLKDLGWGSKRIAKELGVSRGTVKRYLAAGGWQPFRTPVRRKLLDGEDAWLNERLRQHRGNADVVRQELEAEKGIVASLRTVERALAPYRAELAAEARACVRFETVPGRQLQIRLRRAAHRDHRRQGEGVPGDAGLLAPLPCAGLSQRAAGKLARRPGERVPGVRRHA